MWTIVTTMCKGRHSLPHWTWLRGVWFLGTRSVHVGCSWHQWDRWDGDMAWLPRLGPGHHHCFSRDCTDVSRHLGTTGIQLLWLFSPSVIYLLSSWSHQRGSLWWDNWISSLRTVSRYPIKSSDANIVMISPGDNVWCHPLLDWVGWGSCHHDHGHDAAIWGPDHKQSLLWPALWDIQINLSSLWLALNQSSSTLNYEVCQVMSYLFDNLK